MKDNVGWILETRIKPGKMDELDQLADEMVAMTRENEPGTLFYEWSVAEDGETLYLYERFTDSDAAMAHLANFGKHFGKRFMGALRIKSIVIFGPADDRVRSAYAQMNPTYATWFAGFTR